MIFLLLLNITDIFDEIVSNDLMHVLHMKEISEKLAE